MAIARLYGCRCRWRGADLAESFTAIERTWAGVDRFRGGAGLSFVDCGDAAWSPTPLTGLGTSLALVGAYVLAGELAAADLPTALRRYEEVLRPYVGPSARGGRSRGPSAARIDCQRCSLGPGEQSIEQRSCAFGLR